VRVLETLAADRRALDSVNEVDRLARALLALPDRLGSKLRVMERAVLHHAVEACGGNKAAAARLIGMDRKSLERRIDSADGGGKSRAHGGSGPASSPATPQALPDDDE
jgi:two-component system response regulator HydG